MVIKFKDKKDQKICNDSKLMLKYLGQQMANKLQYCLKYLHSANSFDDLNLEPVKSLTRFHPLVADRKGEYAMNISGNFRLIFTKYQDNNEIVLVLEIKKDYH